LILPAKGLAGRQKETTLVNNHVPTIQQIETSRQASSNSWSIAAFLVRGQFPVKSELPWPDWAIRFAATIRLIPLQAGVRFVPVPLFMAGLCLEATR
jgi:hypothetical protein